MINLLKFILVLCLIAVNPVVAQTPGTFSQGTGAPSSNAVNTALGNKQDVSPVYARCGKTAGNGVTDSTSCMQAALNDVCATKKGGNFAIPAGTYLINASVGLSAPCTLTFLGSGMGDMTSSTAPGTVISVINSGSAPILTCNAPFAAGDKYMIGCGVRELTIYFGNAGGTNAATQTGPGILFKNCKQCVIENVRIWAPYIGISNFAGTFNRVSYSIIDQVLSDGGMGVLNSGSDAGCSDIGNCTNRGDVFTVNNTLINANFASGKDTGQCIHIKDFAQTTWINDVVCGQTSIGVNIDCPTSSQLGSCPGFIHLKRFEVEPNGVANSSHAAGIAASDFNSLDCNDCQFFGYNADNLVKLFQGRFTGESDAQFIGGKLNSAQRQCILSNIGSIKVVGNTIFNCGKSGNNIVGIETNGNGSVALSGGNIIIGNTIGWDYINGNAPTNMTGVLLGSGQDYNVITGNSMRGTSVGVTDNSGGTHNVISSNSGP